ncbi:protein FAR1-RELATED SEQUENCE 5-like [Salvia splendens]|uniref:protein FAR1-RELATED SEQUENCE 5-like n=1 Tax=Salvia splendens TaxID=180675 RepID=UPI001C2743F0|nr:protein FAR1-RELATED SEQUENCE 5-like [Salvia splendens]
MLVDMLLVDIFFHYVVGSIIPICNDDLRPYEGQKFSSLEEGIYFYEKYAQEACFDCRRFGNRFSGGVFVFQYVVCNRQGFHTVDLLGVDISISEEGNASDGDEEHNHDMVDIDHKRFMKGNRSMNDVHHKFVEDCTKANIGPTSTFNLLKEFFGSYDVVGFTLNDVRNCSRDINEKLKEVDVQRRSIILICNDELRPYEGKKFSSLEEGIYFYEKYAQGACFDCRRFGNRSSGGVFVFQYVVCNRQGFHTVDPLGVDISISEEGNASDDDEVTSKKKRRRGTKRCGCGARIDFKFYSNCGVKYYLVYQFIKEHNHDMVDRDHKRFMKGNRSMNDVHHKFVEDCTKANIGPTSTFNLLKEFFGSYDVVGFTLNDVRNCSRDIKEKLKEVDVQMILNQMQETKRICEGFFYKYQLSPDDNKLVSLFWYDAESRKHYHMFGDVVTFDTTYSTNMYNMVFGPFTGKDNHWCPIAFGAGFVSGENCDALSWLFTVFVECMSVAPRIIITDQDWAMGLAIEKVLPGTRHRLCMWHIMSKLFEKIPKSIFDREKFSKESKACVWSELLDPDDILWTGIVEKYGVEDHKWFEDMFAIRHL